MDWRPRLYWAMLSFLVFFAAWYLTRTITHVNRVPAPVVGITLDDSHPPQIKGRPDLATLQADWYRIPRIVMMGEGRAMFIVPSGVRTITITGEEPPKISCGFYDHIFTAASPAAVLETAKDLTLSSLSVEVLDANHAQVHIPPQITSRLASTQNGQAGIVCEFAHPIAAAPTFTDRALTVYVRNGPNGPALLDVSALDDIDSVRFSGGLDVPLAGERARLIGAGDSVVSAEWTVIGAEEQRDVALVIIGALAAIGAAMAIEAIRPFIERKSDG